MERAVGGPHRRVGIRGPRHRRGPCDTRGPARGFGGLAGMGTARGRLVRGTSRRNSLPKASLIGAVRETRSAGGQQNGSHSAGSASSPDSLRRWICGEVLWWIALAVLVIWLLGFLVRGTTAAGEGVAGTDGDAERASGDPSSPAFRKASASAGPWGPPAAGSSFRGIPTTVPRRGEWNPTALQFSDPMCLIFSALFPVPPLFVRYGHTARSRAQNPPEVPGEVGLVVEATAVATSAGGRPSSSRRRARSTRRDVTYWWGAMPNAALKARTRCAGCAWSTLAASSSVVPSRSRSSRRSRRSRATRGRSPRDRRGAGRQMCAQAPADQGQPALRLQFVSPVARAAWTVRCVGAGGVGEVGAVDRRADEALVELRHVEVQDTLAEAVDGGGGAVVRHLGRQQADCVVRGAPLVVVQVVADRAVVDDQERPGVMDVHGIGVLRRNGRGRPRRPRDRRAPTEISCRDARKKLQTPRASTHVSLHENDGSDGGRGRARTE